MDKQSQINDSLDAIFGRDGESGMTLTKVHFVEMLNEHLGLNRTEAGTVVESIFREMQNALAQGRDIKLANFGTFSVREKSPRPGRNPKTGEPYEISARRVVTFMPAPHLRQAVAEYQGPEVVANSEEQES